MATLLLEDVLKMYGQAIATAMLDLGMKPQSVDMILSAADKTMQAVEEENEKQQVDPPPNPTFSTTPDSFENAIFTFVVSLTQEYTKMYNGDVQKARRSVIEYLDKLSNGLETLNQQDEALVKREQELWQQYNNKNK